ncbi:GSCFA domain-containing protein [Hallella multisaccharivorax]|uniref:GSCFA domain-containing protein n=1 Tax=Hallella multisaccharivorax TaxID=310514 RepID=UPI00361F192A
MEFRTIVDIPPSPWKIGPCERMLFVGSCFADNIGRRFAEEQFRVVVNPFGVMYNPASILHTVERLLADNAMPFQSGEPGTAIFTLGTNHVYILKETGEIVDNCHKRPQSLFLEQKLSINECADYLNRAVSLITGHFPKVHFLFNVSPIRYRKYGYHGSRLSKATLLLAIDTLLQSDNSRLMGYFPSYEILDDELRDYRFYQPDMLHPSSQAVDYIYDRMAEAYFSDATFAFLKEWRPIRAALGHRPLHPDSEEYRLFELKMEERLRRLSEKYPISLPISLPK